MLLADDIVLQDETKQGMHIKFEIWSNTLESKDFISKMKIEYRDCKFRKNINVDDIMAKLEDQVIPRKH